MKHAPVYRYKRILQPFYEFAGLQDMETVAVVRNPVDWLGSWYRYRHRDEIAGHPNSTKGMTFDDFVLQFIQGRHRGVAAIGSQAKFLLQPDGQIGVDHLFRYEAQPKLVHFLESRLKVKIKLNRLNVSPSVDTALSSPIAAALRQKCAAEFDVWEAGQA